MDHLCEEDEGMREVREQFDTLVINVQFPGHANYPTSAGAYSQGSWGEAVTAAPNEPYPSLQAYAPAPGYVPGGAAPRWSTLEAAPTVDPQVIYGTTYYENYSPDARYRGRPHQQSEAAVYVPPFPSAWKLAQKPRMGFKSKTFVNSSRTRDCDSRYRSEFVYQQDPAGFTFTEMDEGVDLFSAPTNYSLAHCVAADFEMSMGIATTFRDTFQRVDELRGSNKSIGYVATLRDRGRQIFYLITKQRSNQKPRLEHVLECVRELQQKCVRMGVRHLAIPRLGCGLDRLDWAEVKKHIVDIFRDTSIDIRVYYIPYMKKADSWRSPGSEVQRSASLRSTRAADGNESQVGDIPGNNSEGQPCQNGSTGRRSRQVEDENLSESLPTSDTIKRKGKSGPGKSHKSAGAKSKDRAYEEDSVEELQPAERSRLQRAAAKHKTPQKPEKLNSDKAANKPRQAAMEDKSEDAGQDAEKCDKSRRQPPSKPVPKSENHRAELSQLSGQQSADTPSRKQTVETTTKPPAPVRTYAGICKKQTN